MMLILFMNKCNLLEKKIKSGVSIKKSLLSFGDRPNDAASVTKYLKMKLKEILQQCLPPSRTLYIFPMSVTVCLKRPSFAPGDSFVNFDVLL
ncbi:hypothetical protein PILCRDRAFT_798546 [Piloderma croceum F 1598]|uniref:Uncharacterized protein n=1 Tax=Piloderma croceum (strain F 1598) TaxID=765440 RepID=A0A0C3APM7_PILCF|nr:hypothetical protein PILCRDRAFT_798546 [Piloderma croceum F 1598]